MDLGLRTRDVVEIRTRDRSNALLLATLASSPLVESVGVTSHSAFSTGASVRVAPVDGAAVPERSVRHRFASPEYFKVMDIRIVRGRMFGEAEARSEAPVVILSEDAAAQLWPGQNAIGRTVRLASDPSPGQPPRPIRFPLAEVVGVVRQVATAFDASERATVYLPTSADNGGNTGVVVRTVGGVNAALRKLDAALSAADPGAVEQIITLDDLGATRLYLFHAAYWLAGGIGVLALLLTISGIYGVLSYAVARRTQEIGVRIALGASSGRIVEMVVRQSLRLCAFGLAIGLAAALGVSKLLSSVLVMMNMFDLAAFAAGIAIVVAACLAAAFYPARRAARIEPLVALRYE